MAPRAGLDGLLGGFPTRVHNRLLSAEYRLYHVFYFLILRGLLLDS